MEETTTRAEAALDLLDRVHERFKRGPVGGCDPLRQLRSIGAELGRVDLILAPGAWDTDDYQPVLERIAASLDAARPGAGTAYLELDAAVRSALGFIRRRKAAA